MKNPTFRSNLALAGLLILLAALCRLLPHPMNFSPILALALFGGATLPRRFALAIPLGAMLLSDLALSYTLGFGFGPMNAVIYGCFALGAVIGWKWLRANRSWGRTLGATLAGSLLFFAITNAFVWLGPMMAPPFDYPHNFAGLVKCYVLALPFFRNSLAGDLFWTFGLFAAYDAARVWAGTKISGASANAAGGKLAI